MAWLPPAQCLKNRGEGGHFVLGLCFSKHGGFSFKKLFYLKIYFLFSTDRKKIPISFEEVLKINAKYPFWSLRNCSPHKALCAPAYTHTHTHTQTRTRAGWPGCLRSWPRRRSCTTSSSPWCSRPPRTCRPTSSSAQATSRCVAFYFECRSSRTYLLPFSRSLRFLAI